MNRAIAILQKHPLPVLFTAVIVLAPTLYFGAGLLAGFRHWYEDRQVTHLEEKATKAELDAAKEDLNRRVEDLNRDRTIKPELARTRSNVAAARDRARKAEIDYEKARTNPVDTNTDVRTLHDRNCADLRELYPGEPIPWCQ